jgi:Fur family ferric uptake transcriptional regulator
LAAIAITERARSALRATGERVTPARLRVYVALLDSARALSHHELEAALGTGVPVDRVTLYRVLEWLVERDLAHKLAGDDRVWRFSATARGGAQGGAAGEHAHAHFRCVDCGKIVCLAAAGVPALAVPAGYRSDEVEVTVKGHCDRCAG